jgi:hypothetical protein
MSQGLCRNTNSAILLVMVELLWKGALANASIGTRVSKLIGTTDLDLFSKSLDSLGATRRG